jgi:ferredoxin-NADP reductase
MESTLALHVRHIETLTPRVRKLVLGLADGAPLPAYEAGAHIELHVPGTANAGPLHRAYSLVRPSAGAKALEIAVQLEENGSGGSRWVHSLQSGDTLTANPPRNLFPLQGQQQRPLLLAAGIGITPILCMALELERQGLAHEMHYVARSRELAAYAGEVEALAGATCWFDEGDPSRGIPLPTVIGPPIAERHLHVCGPKPFIAAVLDTARQLGWPEEQLHCELFTGALAAQGDRAFEVELKDSGLTLSVAADQTILEAMESAGLDPLFDCRRGDCGICVARVLGGDADHRDICLSAREHEAGNFCICVSRARGERLVLAL